MNDRTSARILGALTLAAVSATLLMPVLAPTASAHAATSARSSALDDDPAKVAVCKYVTKPDGTERLKAGKQPIEVSVSTLKDFPGTFPWAFTDAQERSVAIGWVDGTVYTCPGASISPSVSVSPSASVSHSTTPTQSASTSCPPTSAAPSSTKPSQSTTPSQSASQSASASASTAPSASASTPAESTPTQSALVTERLADTGSELGGAVVTGVLVGLAIVIVVGAALVVADMLRRRRK